MLTLAEILTSQVTTVDVDCMVRSALELMRERKISALVVMEGEQPVGIFTERDAVLLAYKRYSMDDTQIKEVMGKPLLTALPEMGYQDGYLLITEQRVRHLVVVNESGGLVGIVTEGDFLQHIGNEFLVRFKEVGAVMIHNVLTLPSDAWVEDAVRMMTRDHISCVVIEERGEPVGIFTERDLVRLESQAGVVFEAPLSKHMTKPVSTVTEDTPLPEAMHIMDSSKIRRLVVVNGANTVVGLVTRHDIVKQLYNRHVEHLREMLDQRESDLDKLRAELQTERELRRTEERLAEIQRLAHIGSWELNLAKNSIWWSDEAYRIFEVDAQRFGKTFEAFLKLVHPDDRKNVSRAYNKSLVKREPFDIVHRLLFDEGRIKYINMRCETHFDQSGKPQRSAGTVQDVTENHLRQQERDRLHGMIDALVEGSSDAIFVKNREGRYLIGNQALASLIGKSRDELTGVDDFAHFPHDLAEQFRADDRRIMETGNTETYEEPVVAGDTTIPYLTTKGPMVIDGEVAGVFGIARNITLIKKAEEDLRRSEALFRSIFEQAAIGVALIDSRTGRYLRINHRYCEMIGYSTEQMSESMTFKDITHPDDLLSDLDSMTRLMAGEVREFSKKKRYYHRNGSVVWVNLTVSPNWAPGEEPDTYIEVVEEITKAHENELRLHYRLKLESTLAAISTDMAHVGSGELDSKIDRSLQRLGESVNASRSYLFQVDRKSGLFANTHEWCADEVLPLKVQLQDLKIDQFQDLLEFLGRGKVLTISLADKGSNMPALRKHMQDKGISSMLNIPLQGAGDIEGFISFDSEKPEKVWLEEDVSVLLTAAETFCTVMERQQTLEQIEQHTWYLESLDRVSRILSEHQFSSSLMHSLMDLVLEIFNADRVWMIDPCDPDVPFCQVIHESSRPEYLGALTSDGRLMMDRSSSEVMSFALSQAEPYLRHRDKVVDQDDLIHKLGIQSEMMAVLHLENAAPRLLVIHQCRNSYLWNPVEKALFRAVSERIAMALSGYLLLERIRKSEKRLLEAEHTACMGHWELDVATGLAKWSGEIHAILGTDPNQPAGPALLSSLVNPEDWPAVQKSLNSAIQHGSKHEMEYRVSSLDGQRHWIYCKAARELDDQGNPSRLIGIAQDITGRKKVEQELARAGAEWTQAMDQLDDAVYMLDIGRHLRRANEAFYQMVNSSPEQCVGRHITELIHPQDICQPCSICEAQEKMQEGTITLEADDPANPHGHPIDVTLNLIRDETGKPTGILTSIHDLTNARQINERLRLSANVFDNTAEAIVVTGADGSIVEVNQAFLDIMGFSRGEVIGNNPSMWKSGRHDSVFFQSMWKSLEETGRWRGEIWNRRKDGSIFPEWQNISAVTDNRGSITHYLSVSSDISQIKQSQEKLDHLAHYDALTDLPNRLLLTERLEQAIKHAERHKRNLAVFFIDIDRFKHVNDSLGHPVGDLLLQEVSKKLLEVVRHEDTVSRIGGDEFVIVLDEVDEPEHAGTVAQKILKSFEEPFLLEGRDISVTTSLGICLYPSDGQDADTLLRNADAAMYRAKDEGRNNYQFYTEELTRDAFERVLLEAGLRRAIENDELRLFFQPQVDLKNNTLIGLEALVRWWHPDFGMVSPVRFIPLAEETGLIFPLGRWVLQTACRQGVEWLQRGIDFGRIAVNVAGPQIQRGGLVDEVRTALSESGLPAKYLELEVTEGFIMQQAEAAISQLEALQELGVLLSIDDFGTGYSSLSYLKRLPIDKLKIDKSFVRDIPDDANDLAIAGAVIALGKSLNLKVIAEGVETEEQAIHLKDIGCEAAQGYLYCRPAPNTDLDDVFVAYGLLQQHS
ncbi:MAG: PAS domain S-box protein [Candidatus Thiodiazotropha sp. L084R]